MRKIISILMLLLIIVVISGCKKKPDDNEKYIEKPYSGVDPLFFESLGYYNETPSVMQISDTEMYIYYTKNEVINTTDSDAIVVRYGELKNDKWEFNEPQTILQKSQTGWDSSHIYAPSVIKGDFKYNGKSYKYLMAYSGDNYQNERKESQIGLAVSNSPATEFIKIGKPIVTYDSTYYGLNTTYISKGASEPSLVSFDKHAKVYLFYTMYTPGNDDIRFLEFDLQDDLKDLAQKQGERGLYVHYNGLDDNLAIPGVYSGDWAWNDSDKSFYVVKEYYPTASTAPYVAEGVQIICGGLDVLYGIDTTRDDEDTDPKWTILNSKINNFDTGIYDNNERMLGYLRVYSPAIIRDEYGWYRNNEKVEILYTSSQTITQRPNDFQFTPSIHYYSHDLE